MEAILNFLVDNYLWFLIISLILIFGLIGYIVDARERKTPKLHFEENEDLSAQMRSDSEDKTIQEMLQEQEILEPNNTNEATLLNEVVSPQEEKKETELTNE